MNNNIKFGISNFRVFKEMNNFEIAPITFLTGPNSSGKSSIIKAIQLFKDNSKGEMIPYKLSFDDNDSKLDNIESVLNNKDKDIEIEFETNFNLKVTLNYSNGQYHDEYDNIQIDRDSFIKNINIEFGGGTLVNINLLSFVEDVYFHIKNNESTSDYTKYINIENSYFDINKFKLFFSSYLGKCIEDSKKTITYLKSKNNNDSIGFFEKNKEDNLIKLNRINNGTIFELFHEDELLSQSLGIDHDIKNIEQDVINKLSFTDCDLIDYFTEHIKNRINEINHSLIQVDSVVQFYIESFISASISFVGKKIQERIDLVSSINYQVRFSEVGLFLIEDCTKYLFAPIKEYLKDINNIVPIPISKNLKDDSFFSTKNVSNSFLGDIAKKYLEHSNLGSAGLEHEYLEKKWMSKDKFGIGKSIKIDQWKSFFEISIIDFEDRKVSLKDMGYGVGQIISLLLLPFELKGFESCNFDYNFEFTLPSEFEKSNKIFYLEEPESNLHPKWQSLLVELLVELNQIFGYRFIIESHSEYMIRKAQCLVAKQNEIQKVFKIYYFNGANINNDKKCFEIKINKSGMLDKDFGPGFFDESTNLTLDLLRINSLN